jgi:hypothetical protein
MTWAQVMTLGGTIIGAMWALFKWGLDGELQAVRSQLEIILEKVGKVDKLAGDIREIQTVLRMNGCIEGEPSCGRRRDDR